MKAATVDTQSGLIGWILAAIGTVVSTLAGLVVMFYKNQIADYKATKVELCAKVSELEKRADVCEVDRNQLQIKCAVLESKYGALEQRVADVESNKANRETVNRRIDELKQ